MTSTAESIGGGTGGWIGGAAAGAALGSAVPIIGTAIGGFFGVIAGAFGGGALAGKASKAILDNFFEDDADKMVAIIENVFAELCDEWLIRSVLPISRFAMSFTVLEPSITQGCGSHKTTVWRAGQQHLLLNGERLW